MKPNKIKPWPSAKEHKAFHNATRDAIEKFIGKRNLNKIEKSIIKALTYVD